ncbi:CHAT domain-containing protein [Nonomuraea sp. NPDC049684]|uniref:CHAT domain-containing protein n=1 Tax=Nonomuraea sp. NPDC049684 TaxID=3364356 RepID=UPI0037B72B44
MVRDLVQVDAMLAQVTTLVDAHRLPEAEALLKALLERLDELPADRRVRVLLEWGWHQGAVQRNDVARAALAEAVALAERLGEPKLLCEALREAAIVARYDGDYLAADRLLERSEQVARKGNDDLEVGYALVQRAKTAHLDGDFVKARGFLLEALRAAERCPPGPAAELLLAGGRGELALSARLARDYDTARDLLVQSLEGYRGLGRRVGAANAERELGAVLAEVGKREEARRHYAAAFAGHLRAGRRFGAAQVARRMGNLDMTDVADDPAVAARVRRRFAQSLRLGGGEAGNQVLTTLGLAQLARLEGDLDAAEELLDDVVQMYSAMGGGQNIARGLSQAALEAGLIARGRADRPTAIMRFREALAALRVSDDPGAAGLVHYHLATELILADQVDEATRHAVAAFELDEEHGRRLRAPDERRSFYESHRHTYGLALHCAARAGDGRTALKVATAARSDALAAFVRAGATFAPALRELIGEITLRRAELRSRDARPEDADRLRELYRRLEDETSRQLRQTVEGGADLDEMIASLPEGGHALLVDVLEEDDTFCHRIWVTSEGVRAVEEVIMPTGVRRHLDAYHQAQDEIAWQPQETELAELGRTLVPGELAETLAAGANPPLIVSTGSVLGPVPVAALMIDGRYLAELAQISVVPSLALWSALRARPPRRGRGTLAFLDHGLPGWRREKDALRSMPGPVELAGQQELRDRLADASGYAAVVLSAHGAEPRSGDDGPSPHAGLAQAVELGPDDLLTAAQLLGCRLPDAFITASCWSGRLAVRAAVDPLGLPTAALLAGARWVLAGTVDIGSTPTATLLRTFYELLRAGIPPSAALQRAQLDYLRRRSSPAPGTWAGLTVIGDGLSPLLPESS